MNRAEAEPYQIVIDHAEIVAVEVTPDDRHESGRDDDRQEIGEPKEIKKISRHRPIERERQ